MKVAAAVALAFTLAAGAAADPPPADSLTAAKSLYATAAYEDALAMLTRLADASNDKVQIDEYRSLCLYALGHGAEAEAAVKDLLERNPLFEVDTDDVSPRVEAMFTDVRKRVLPEVARSRYRAARTAIDARQFAAAEPDLEQVHKIIAEATRLGVKDESLSDLDVLADGFRDLVRAKAAEAPPTERPAPQPATAAASGSVVRAADAPSKPKAYDASDAGITPPVTLVQTVPPLPEPLAAALHRRKGLVELTIGTDGRVESAVIRQSLNVAYDEMVLNAAKAWRYRPALKDGVPVRYVKAIGLEYRGSD